MTRAFSLLAPASLACLTLGLACCNGGGGGTGGTNGGGTTSGTSGTPNDGGPYTIVKLDPAAANQTEFCMGVSPAGQIGIGYYKVLGDGGEYAGFLDSQLLYTEVDGTTAQVTVPAAATRGLLQLSFGCSIGFQPSGLPAIGFFGGTDYNGTNTDAGPSGSLYWVQSQAEIDYRQSDGSWLRDICMESSTGGQCQVSDPPNANCPTSNDATDNGFDWTINYDGMEDKNAEQLYNNPFGEIVGLWPALLFDGGTAVLAFRDVHEGQFPIQDWGASDTKMCIGGPAADFSYSAPLTISAAGDNQHNGYGVHNTMVFGPGGKLAIAGDIDAKDVGSEVTGSGPITFTMQTGTNTQSNADWTPPMDPFDPAGSHPLIQNPGSGPSMTYDLVNGFGIAVVDTQPNPPILYYVHSMDGMSWSAPVPVAQYGSEGFFPDLAVDPTGNPIVSYLVCSTSDGFSPDKDGCDANTAEVDTAELTAAGWGEGTTALTGALWHPRMGYLPNGKQIFVYSDMINGGLYLAIQK